MQKLFCEMLTVVAFGCFAWADFWLSCSSWCRHHLMYFSQISLSCRCCMADFVVLRDSSCYVCLRSLPPRLMPRDACEVLSLLLLRTTCIINSCCCYVWLHWLGALRESHRLYTAEVRLQSWVFSKFKEVFRRQSYYCSIISQCWSTWMETVYAPNYSRASSFLLLPALWQFHSLPSRLYPGLKTAVAPEQSGEMISQLWTDLLPSLEAALGGTWIDDNLRVYGIPANCNQSKRLTQVSGLTLVRTRGVSWLLWTLLLNPTTSHSSAESSLVQ